jgi:hypothetical protein
LIIIIDGFDLWLIGQTMSRHHFYYYIKWTGRKSPRIMFFFLLTRKVTNFLWTFYIYINPFLYI